MIIIFFILSLLLLFLFLLYNKNKCKENFNTQVINDELIKIGTCLNDYSNSRNWNDTKKYSHSIRKDFLSSYDKRTLDNIKENCKPVIKYYEVIELLNSLICENEYKSYLENNYDSFEDERKTNLYKYFESTD